jgi:translation initiation factor IF-3
MAKKYIKEKVNNQILAKEVRLVGDNITPGVYDISEAQQIANNLDLDLVEINSVPNPPIVKVIDYNKYQYIKKAKAKELKKKQKESKQTLKEIRFGPNTDEHDYQFKAKHARNFLENGDLVKAYVFFKGREIAFKDQGKLLLVRLADDLSDVGLPITLDFKLEGKRMIMNLKPRKKNK